MQESRSLRQGLRLLRGEALNLILIGMPGCGKTTLGRRLAERMGRPYLMGRDLIDAGVEPGPLYTEALAAAHKLRLAGRPKEEQLKHALSIFRKEKQSGGN